MAIIRLRRDTAANWANQNPTLALGEPGVETDTNKMKIGDGSTAWLGLSYASGGGSADLGNLRIDTWGYPGNNPVRLTNATPGESILVQSTDNPEGNQGRSSLRWHIRPEPDGMGSQYSQVDVQHDGVWIKNADWSGNEGQWYWHFDNSGKVVFPDNTEQTTAYNLNPNLAKINDKIVLTGELHLGAATGGSVSEFDSEGNTYVWFNTATGDNTGRKYAVGNDDYGNAFIVAYNLDGTVRWKYTFGNVDVGAATEQVHPYTAKHYVDNSNTEFIYVGFDVGQYCGVAKFALDGSVTGTWFYQHSADNYYDASLDSHGLEIDADGSPIIVGQAYGEWVPFNDVTAQTGSNDYTLVVNRADLGNATSIWPWNSNSWRVDVAGDGSWFQPNQLNVFKNVPVTRVTGIGGKHTALEDTAFSAGGVVFDFTGTNPIMKIAYSSWSNTTERDLILAHSSGQLYQFVCAPGSAYNFVTDANWTDAGEGVWTVTGSFGVISGDSISTAVNVTDIHYGEDAVLNVYYYIDDNGHSFYNGADIVTPGTGYSHGDLIKVPGSLLGGTDGGLVAQADSVTNNGSTWYFSQGVYPSFDAAISVGNLVRFNNNDALGTVTNIGDAGDGNWAVDISMTSGQGTVGTVYFYAGNDFEANYYVNWNYVQQTNNIPVQDKVRFVMDQQLTINPTYTVKRNTDSQAFVIGYNFTHTIGGANNQSFTSVSLDKVNNILYAEGYFDNMPSPGNDNVLFAFDYPSGNILWQKSWDDTTGYSNCSGIIADGANNCVYVPWENDNGYVILMKLDTQGNLVWASRLENNNWNNTPQPLVDSHGDVFLVGGYDIYEPTSDRWDYELMAIKLSQTDGSLLWAQSVTRMTNRLSVYEYYDTDATPVSMVNDIIYFGGYIYDRNDNYSTGLAIAIPANGSGLGSNGDWDYRTYTDTLTFSVYTSSVTLYSQDVPHPDALGINSASYGFNINSDNPGWLTRAEAIGGGSKFTFEDGGEIAQTGIPRHSVQHGGGNDIWLTANMNGKFIYFGDNPNGWSSTIKLPHNNNTSLPIGFTVTVAMNQFSSQTVYVNNDSNGDVQILASGNSSTGTWYWKFGGDGTPGVYTIMKVDTNTWMLAGPNVQVD